MPKTFYTWRLSLSRLASVSGFFGKLYQYVLANENALDRGITMLELNDDPDELRDFFEACYGVFVYEKCVLTWIISLCCTNLSALVTDYGLPINPTSWE
jgi:hypothetical protein